METQKLVIASVLPTLAACTSEPFSYTEDRCLGQYNQCRTDCLDADEFGARYACAERCLDRESRCYASGPDSVGSSLAQDALIARQLDEKEKQADFERYKAQKEREAEEADAAEDEVDD